MDIDFCSQHLLAFDNTLFNEDDDIKAKAKENLTKIIECIKGLKNEVNDEGEIIYYLSKKTNIFEMPRYSRVPKMKEKTTWQKFADKKHIKKKKRGLMYDQNTKGWVRTFQKRHIKRNEEQANFVHEFKENENVFEDPFEKREEEKEYKKMKQKMREMKNKLAQEGITNKDVLYIERQKRKRKNLVDTLKTAQISSSTFGRADKSLKKEKKIKVRENVTKKKCENLSLKAEMEQNNKLAQIVLKKN